METWIKEYSKQLTSAFKKYPREYTNFKPDQIGVMIRCMRKDFTSGLFTAEGRAMEATAKKLGVKFTREAILEFIGKNK